MRALHVPLASLLLSSGAFAVACGSSDGGAQASSADAGAEAAAAPGDDDAGPGPQAAFPAFAPQDPPQVQDMGGPVLKAPKIIPVFFHGDDPKMTAQLADFTHKIGQTDYWKAIVTEYGSGPATGLDPIQLTQADDPSATIDDSDIQTWLAGKLNANDPAFGTPDENTIYALYYPHGVTITLNGGGGGAPDGGVPEGGVPDAGGGGFGGVQKSCSSFGGYHQDIRLDDAHNGLHVAYAVLPRCASFGALTGVDAVTGAASHEFMEASTDPYPIANPAYATVDDAHSYWQSFVGGGEIGDMCAQNTTSFVRFAEMAYVVQRGWSNKAVAGGHDPCVPTTNKGAYFNAVPAFKDTLTLSFGPSTVTTKGVKIPVGQSATVELDLFSDGPTNGPWTVSAMDQNQMRGQAAQLKFDFDKTNGQNGDRIQMTITVLTASKRNRESFAVLSKMNGLTNMWAGVVGN
jgi:hypothetical protein